MNSGASLRILLVVDSLDIGGAERHVVDLAAVLRGAGHDIAVACSALGPLQSELEAHGIPIHILARRCVKRRLRFLFGWKVRRIVRSGCFDLVHAHMYAASAAAALATVGTGTPLVITEHSEAHWRGPLTRLFSWFLYGQAHAIIAVSAPIRDRLRRDGVPSYRITVIPNAIVSVAQGGLVNCLVPDVDLRWCRGGIHQPAPVALRTADMHAYPQADEYRPYTTLSRGLAGQERVFKNPRCSDSDMHVPTRIGVIARLNPEKGIFTFLEAAALLAQPLPSCRFLIAGDGPLRGELQSRADGLGLTDRLIFLGMLPSARQFLPCLDLLVVPSLSEGSPLVILEAMAAGVPIVASAVGGIPDQIRHGKEGLLVPAGNPAALVAACLLLLHDPEYAERLSRAARARVHQCFNHAAMIRETEVVYRRVLGRVDVPMQAVLKGHG